MVSRVNSIASESMTLNTITGAPDSNTLVTAAGENHINNEIKFNVNDSDGNLAMPTQTAAPVNTELLERLDKLESSHEQILNLLKTLPQQIATEIRPQ